MSPEKRVVFLEKRHERWRTKGCVEDQKRKALDPERYAELARLRQKRFYMANPAKYKQVQKTYRLKLKLAAMEAYGGACACCGENEIEFLTIDHIKPIRKHKRLVGAPFYHWLRDQKYPVGFQVLCFNCNCAKRTADECPHKRIYMKKFRLLTGLAMKGAS